VNSDQGELDFDEVALVASWAAGNRKTSLGRFIAQASCQQT